MLQENTTVPCDNAAEPNLCTKFDSLVFAEGVTGKEVNTVFELLQLN
jgi:hypothetical protein